MRLRKELMEYLIGLVAAVAACVFIGMLAGFDRERVFYPTMMAPIATYYILFAAMGGSTRALTVETLVAGLFLLAAVAGFKTTLWLAAAALAAHGVFDVFHAQLIQNSGTPAWWPGFCATFDILAALFLAMLLTKRPGFVRAQ